MNKILCSATELLFKNAYASDLSKPFSLNGAPYMTRSLLLRAFVLISKLSSLLAF